MRKLLTIPAVVIAMIGIALAVTGHHRTLLQLRKHWTLRGIPFTVIAIVQISHRLAQVTTPMLSPNGHLKWVPSLVCHRCAVIVDRIPHDHQTILNE
jgi:membrane protein implicated in regulation of membrane protease activity